MSFRMSKPVSQSRCRREHLCGTWRICLVMIDLYKSRNIASPQYGKSLTSTACMYSGYDLTIPTNLHDRDHLKVLVLS